MNNPTHKVLTLSTYQIDDGEGGKLTVPTIPGNVFYSVGKFIVAYGKSINNVHPPLAFCRELNEGQYLVIAEQSMIDELDPFSIGETVEEMSDEWLMWRIDGDEPVEEGGRRDVYGKLIVFIDDIPNLDNVSEDTPVTLPGNIQAIKAWPSLDGTIGGYDFLAVVEPSEE